MTHYFTSAGRACGSKDDGASKDRWVVTCPACLDRMQDPDEILVLRAERDEARRSIHDIGTALGCNVGDDIVVVANRIVQDLAAATRPGRGTAAGNSVADLESRLAATEEFLGKESLGRERAERALKAVVAERDALLAGAIETAVANHVGAKRLKCQKRTEPESPMNATSRTLAALDLAIETEGVESDEMGDEYPGTGTLAEVGDWVASIRGTAPEDNDYGQVMGIERSAHDDNYITVRIAWEGSGVATQVALSSLDVDVYTSHDAARDAYFATVPGGR